MTDTALPNNEQIEQTIKKSPLELLSRIPDGIESREAKRLINVTADLVHRAREKAKESAE